jgi:hypothetical protein
VVRGILRNSLFKRIDPQSLHLSGVDLAYADKNERVNASEAVMLREKLYESCRDFHSEVYSFCAREYPETERLWVRRNGGVRVGAQVRTIPSGVISTGLITASISKS